MKTHNPPTVAGPFATYAHGVEVAEPVRLLFGAGQVGVGPDGVIGDGIEEQAEMVWRNIGEVLASADLEISDIVQLNLVLIDRTDQSAAAAVRAGYWVTIGPPPPLCTLPRSKIPNGESKSTTSPPGGNRSRERCSSDACKLSPFLRGHVDEMPPAMTTS